MPPIRIAFEMAFDNLGELARIFEYLITLKESCHSTEYFKIEFDNLPPTKIASFLSSTARALVTAPTTWVFFYCDIRLIISCFCYCIVIVHQVLHPASNKNKPMQNNFETPVRLTQNGFRVQHCKVITDNDKPGQGQQD